MKNKPPAFVINNEIIALLQDIAHELGVLSGAKLDAAPINLRKNNRIKTIQSSLAIEGNTLTIEQVRAIANGKKVLAPEREIMEVNNAVNVYDNLKHLDPLSINSLLKAHQLLMQGLIKDNGTWRENPVGIYKGYKITHIAPPARRVQELMHNLFGFINSGYAPWIIKACVFHYELEFIHPFSDGNGRMGRLWQQLLLMKANPVFEYIPIETLIKDNQEEYYNTLGSCDKLGESTLFIEFMGKQILEALQLYTGNTSSLVSTPKTRLEFAEKKLKQNQFSRKDYMLMHKDISTATASRDLAFGLKEGILEHKGERNQVVYMFKPNTSKTMRSVLNP